MTEPHKNENRAICLLAVLCLVMWALFIAWITR